MKKIYVNVTQKDITHGRKGDRQSCPIARAVRRHFDPTKIEVSISSLTIIVWSVDGSYDIIWDVKTPDVAEEFIHNFDSGKLVSPFKFTVEVPE
jgi:hypothetical protein